MLGKSYLNKNDMREVLMKIAELSSTREATDRLLKKLTLPM